jgi:hypothetical protein
MCINHIICNVPLHPSSFFRPLPINEFKHPFPKNLCIHYNNLVSITFLHFHFPCQIFENDRRNDWALNIHESFFPHHNAMPTFNPIQLLAPLKPIVIINFNLHMMWPFKMMLFLIYNYTCQSCWLWFSTLGVKTVMW